MVGRGLGKLQGLALGRCGTVSSAAKGKAWKEVSCCLLSEVCVKALRRGGAQRAGLRGK
jgi:hypothetical protein